MHGRLDGDGVDLAEQQLHQRQQPPVQCRRQTVVPCLGRLDHGVHGPRDHIRCHADDSRPAQGHQGQCLVIVARIDRQITFRQDPARLGDIAAGFLDPREIGDLRKGPAGIHGDIHPGPGWHIVGNDGKIDRARDGFVVLQKSRLGAFVVVGRHHQQSVHTQLLGPDAQLHGICGTVAPGPGDDPAPTSGGADPHPEQLQLFLLRQSRRLPCCPRQDDGLRPGVDLPADQHLKQRTIDLPLQKWRHQCGTQSGKQRSFHSIHLRAIL